MHSPARVAGVFLSLDDMATKIEIISDALVELRARPITSLSENQLAVDADRLYDLERSRLLRLHPWRFLRKQATLSTAITPALTFDWAYHFALPADCLRVWQVGRKDYPLDYELIHIGASAPQGGIATNVTPVPIFYSLNLTDEAQFPDWFASVLQSAMVARLAYRVTNSRTIAESAKNEHRDVLAKAKAEQGSEVLSGLLSGANDAIAARY